MSFENLPLNAKRIQRFFNPRIDFAIAFVLLKLVKPSPKLLPLFNVFTGDVDVASFGLESEQKGKHIFKAVPKIPVPTRKLFHSPDLLFGEPSVDLLPLLTPKPAVQIFAVFLVVRADPDVPLSNCVLHRKCVEFLPRCVVRIPVESSIIKKLDTIS